MSLEKILADSAANSAEIRNGTQIILTVRRVTLGDGIKGIPSIKEHGGFTVKLRLNEAGRMAAVLPSALSALLADFPDPMDYAMYRDGRLLWDETEKSWRAEMARRNFDIVGEKSLR